MTFDQLLFNLPVPGPDSTAYLALHKRLAAFAGVPGCRLGGSFSGPKGGMGAVAAAMVGTIKAAGPKVRVNAPVAQVRVGGDRAVGVTVTTAEEIRADWLFLPATRA